MTQYIIKRMVIAMLTMVTVTIFIFFIFRMGEADPVSLMLPPNARSDMKEMLMEKFGLDKPLILQFFSFAGNAARGDFGLSFRYQEPALKLVLSRVPATLELAVAALLLSALIGLPLGILTAVKQGSWVDNFGKGFALIGQATPSFWLGILLILLLGVFWGLFPISGRGGWGHLVLPALTISAPQIAAVTRLSRSAMIDALKSEYVTAARLKGAPEYLVILLHALKNASIPVLTMMSVLLSYLLSGAVVVETIFSWPGLGRLAMQSVFARDYPVVQVLVILSSFIFITINLLVDIIYVLIDPRISYQ
jgi:peptide/nickel transport system permease protein